MGSVHSSPNRRTLIAGGLAVSLSIIASRASARAQVWPNGRRGAVSLTYDDGLDSQLDIAVPALDALGLKATFFLTMTNIRHRLADWAALPASGHELANHTISHPCDLQRFTPTRFMKQQIEPMEQWLASTDPHHDHPVFAYPCDVTNLGPGSANNQAHRYARLLHAAGIAAARTSEGEPNNPASLRERAYRLQALAIGYDAPDLATVTNYLEVAARRGHWAILVFHEITTGVPSEGGVAQLLHDAILRHVSSSPLWAAPMGEVFALRV